jgi:hypothetical protein
MRASHLLLVTVLCACSPADQTQSAAKTGEDPGIRMRVGIDAGPTENAANDGAELCVAETSREWTVDGVLLYRVTASLNGITCRNAIARLTFTEPGGRPRAELTYAVANLHMVFAPRDDFATYRERLSAWITNVDLSARTSALPPWPADADRPPRFLPSMTRDEYEAARQESRPMFCFNNGGESEECVVAFQRRLQIIGARLYERD